MGALKWIAGGVGVVVLAGAAGVGAWLWTPAGPAFDADAARADAQRFEARVIRDRFGVPHIYGARHADVVFGLAYAHAEDDWLHTEEVVRQNRGQLAELRGEGSAVSDYLMHALGNIAIAERDYETRVSPAAKAIAEGYAAGLNLWCAENLDSGCARTAPVRPQDIIAGLSNRPPFFYGVDSEISSVLNGQGPVEVAVRQAVLNIADDIELGSNALAVAPSRSTDGHTRLAVNSHQPYTGTVAWYEARLKSDEGIDLIGGVFPGSPLILHGAGPNIGWAATVNRPDVSDIFLLDVDDAKKPTRYRMDGEWKDLETRPINFRVKLWGPFSLPVTRTAYFSEHGPVFVTDRGVFALSYMTMGELRYLDQYLAMNTARTVADWRAAQETINAIPSINYVVADSEGSIAYFYNARMPMREEGWDRRKVLPGDISDTLWKGVEPPARMPAVINPASGYVVNANHTPFLSTAPEENPRAEDYPASFGIDRQLTNRGLRAQELYGYDTAISREAFIAYKMDHHYSEDSNVRKMVDELLAAGDGGDAELAAALEVIGAWNGAADITNRQAALAIRTGQTAMGGQINQEADLEKKQAALKEQAGLLNKVYGRLDPEWGEVSRLCRGDTSWPTNGGPDILRAVYAGGDLVAQGHLCGAAGDTYIVIADWAPDGSFRIDTIHQFGSATIDETSPHYADQAPLFAAGEFRTPPMALEDLLAEATRDYRPGK